MTLPTAKEKIFQEKEQSGDPFDPIYLVSYIFLSAYMVEI